MSSATVLDPRVTAELVCSIADDVTVETAGVVKLAEWLSKRFATGEYSLLNWKQHELHPDEANQRAIEWIFLVDSLNFSFWTHIERNHGSKEDNRWIVEWKGKRYSGYWALCAAVNRALEEGINLTDANYIRDIDLDTVAKVFRSATCHPIPLLEERHRILREHASILIEKFNGKFSRCVEKSGGSAKKLLQLVVENFPSFRDQTQYKGHQVAFYKRAQILIGDIWACFEGKGLGEFHDIDCLTMFADYRVPQVLYYFGAIRYSDHLLDILRRGQLLDHGSSEESEIRAASIWAVEKAREKMNSSRDIGDSASSSLVNSILIDYCLWDYRRQNAEEIDACVPFHQVRTIFY